MTGPEHYAEAERLIRPLHDGSAAYPANIALAQVHATLALTVATVDLDDGDEWAQVFT